jgi:hypothetical protein
MEVVVVSVEVEVEGESIGALTPPFTIGRDPDCDVILPDSSVSRRHVKVSLSDSGLFVEDVGSSNGTWVDGRRISREIIPIGHPVIVGRVSVIIRHTESSGGEDLKPISKPETTNPKEARKETLAVDIPQGYFDPSKNAPAMRMFECPGCSRRLRCASTTRRVKCRTCEAIIRFDGDIPKLETKGKSAANPAPKAPSERLTNERIPPTPAEKPIPQGQPSPSQPSRHRETIQAKVARMPFMEFIAQDRQGQIAIGLESFSLFMFLFGFVLGKSESILILAATIHLTTVLWALSLWHTYNQDQPADLRTVEERLRNADSLLSQGAISPQEHQKMRQKLLDSV